MILTKETLAQIIRSNAGDFAVYRIEGGKAGVVHYSANIPAFSGLTSEEYERLLQPDSLAGVVKDDLPFVAAQIGKTAADGSDTDFTFRIYHAQRGFSWVHAKVRRLCAAEQGAALIIVNYQNTSEETDTFANLLDESLRIIYVIDAKNCELYYANKSALDFWHLSKLSEGPCYACLHKMKSRCSWCFQNEMKGDRLHKDASYNAAMDRYLQIDAQRVRWYGRESIAIFATDVTESYKAKLSMENKNSEMTRVINSIPAGICIFRMIAGVITCVDVNPYCCQLVGRKREELVGEQFDNISTRAHPDDRAAMARTFTTELAAKRSTAGTFRFFNPAQGRYIWLQLEATLAAQPDGEDYCYMNITDVTPLKEAQTNAEENRSIYELAAQTGGLVVWEYDIKRHAAWFISSDAVAQRNMPQRLDDFPQSMLKYLDKRSVPGFLAMYEKVDAGQSASCEIWHKTDADDEMRCDRLECKFFSSAGGAQDKVYGIGREITAEKLESEKYGRTLQELLTVNPLALCTFRLNLTQNTCSEGHGTSRYIQEMLKASTVDGLFDNIAGIISVPSDERKFRSLFNRKALLDCFSRGQPHSVATYRRLVDSGGSHWVSTYANMLKNPDTGDIEAIAYSVDIDRETKEGQIISSITKSEYDYVALIDTETHDMSFFNTGDKNSSALPVQMPSYDETARKTLAAFAEPADAGRCDTDLAFNTVIEKLSRDDCYTFSYLLHDENGRKCRKQITFRYLDETKKQILLTRSDVTAAFLQEQLQAARIQDALETAERANKLKSDFLSNVSHDMRTPLNAVLGYADLALKSRDLPATRDYLEKIQKAGTTLLSLINDTLDLQKIETGATKIKLAPVSCSEVIKGIITAVKPMMDAKHINFVFDNSKAAMATINTDSMRIQEIMINLLSNAAKFTPEGGRIDFIIECLELEQDRVHDKLIVRDNGCGISAGFLPKIFEPFSQERTAETACIGGSGLGLSIVRRLLGMMGGTIEVSSELGKGSEFTVYIDFERLDEAAAAAGDEAAAPLADVSGLRVLLCEDNEMNTEIARTMLEMHGASVTCASNGEEGVKTFAASEPGEFAVILMDIRMPVMDGYAATSTIRALKRPDARTVPIIAMSADAFEDDVKKSLESGMTAHVAKPIDPDKLFAVLGKIDKK